MDNLVLYNKLAMLPDSFKQDVSDFIDKLLAKNSHSPNKIVSGFGSLKGKIIMADDFDEPLECFKDYMPNLKSNSFFTF